MKIGLIGLGYWGKIILNNLNQLGYNDIIICEENKISWGDIGTKYPVVTSYKNLECDVVFIITPATHHYEICNYFLKKGINVFCEKPLTLSSNTSLSLYENAKIFNSSLFVDWVFLYNPCVEVLKKMIRERGVPKSIIANRLNFGPVREDVNARWDLASHDVSIVRYLLDEMPNDVQWLDFKRNNDSIQNDSTIGILSFKNTNVQINSSWEFGKKDRLFTLEFSDGFVYWDDNDKSIVDGFNSIDVPSYSPLHKSINSFMSKEFDSDKQKELTLDIIKILEK